MKIVFAHDHKFKNKDGVVFSSGSFPSYVWKRYLRICDQLTVVGRDGGGELDSSAGLAVSSIDGVVFEFIPNLSNFRSLVFGNREALRVCMKVVSGSDGVIARLPSRVGMLFVREAIKQNKPYAIEVVADPAETFKHHGSWQGKVYAGVAARELKSALKNAPFSIYVTQNHLQKLYPAETGYVEACSNVEIKPVPRYILDRRLENYSNNANSPALGLIGNFSASYKGIDFAIRALAEVINEVNGCRLKIVGKGDPSAYVSLAESLGVSDRIDFVGALPAGEAIFQWLDSIDVYLQPSLSEGLPRALIEAMSRGCPAIASEVGGIPELLSKKQMVQPGDYKNLAKKIVDLLDDRNAQRHLATENFKKAESYYSSLIEERRSKFWLSFQRYVSERAC
ncbi:glycosyltransferase [Halomonas sp. RA08-2]|uniref:glycosyltransferase n=1 Tax=Halomonas sp. RA08-2 TaxID=3440842 RepID=UPI003F498D94